jgi:hypothetical protein
LAVVFLPQYLEFLGLLLFISTVMIFIGLGFLGAVKAKPDQELTYEFPRHL